MNELYLPYINSTIEYRISRNLHNDIHGLIVEIMFTLNDVTYLSKHNVRSLDIHELLPEIQQHIANHLAKLLVIQLHKG